MIQRIQIFGNPAEMGSLDDVKADIAKVESELREIEQDEAEVLESEEANKIERKGKKIV